jgi:uncharacterized protein YqjF (DUF2071 family)
MKERIMSEYKSVFLSAEWRNLIMINYEVDQKVLLPYLPDKTELDSLNGKFYVSLVAFHFLNTKVKGISFPFHRDFEEVNLRFYVKYKESGIYKKGVVFISEMVPKRMIAFIARLLYGEKYSYAPITSTIKESDTRVLNFAWGNKLQHHLTVETEKNVQTLTEGSKEQFILEHYWGYTGMKNNATLEYKVGHPSWNIFPVRSFEIYVNFSQLYGTGFSFLNETEPASVVVAEGSKVQVYDGKKI